MRKSAENDLVQTMKARELFSYKFPDALTCPNCGQLIYKREKAPDYMIAERVVYVEVKQDSATGRWDFHRNIRDIQREFMNEKGGWLYLVLGQGKAPKGKSAWLMPWAVWSQVEKFLLERGQKTLTREDGKRNIGAINISEFKPYELVWEKGRWVIPDGHEFNKAIGGKQTWIQ